MKNIINDTPLEFHLKKKSHSDFTRIALTLWAVE